MRTFDIATTITVQADANLNDVQANAQGYLRDAIRAPQGVTVQRVNVTGVTETAAPADVTPRNDAERAAVAAALAAVRNR